jgi:hypothetical protein
VLLECLQIQSLKVEESLFPFKACQRVSATIVYFDCGSSSSFAYPANVPIQLPISHELLHVPEDRSHVKQRSGTTAGT